MLTVEPLRVSNNCELRSFLKYTFASVLLLYTHMRKPYTNAKNAMQSSIFNGPFTIMMSWGEKVGIK